MADPRTMAYLRELRLKLERQKREIIDTASELCDCPDCIDARLNKKTISTCQSLNVFDKVLGEGLPSNFLPELSSNPKMWDFAERHRSNRK